MISLKFDGIGVPLDTLHDIQQNYANVDGGMKSVRTLNGRLSVTSLWKKLKTTISGNGWRPSDSGMYRGRQVVLSCIQPRAIDSLARTFEIPLARRMDEGIKAFAQVNGEYLPIGFSQSGQSVLVDENIAATSYRVMYWPELLVCVMDVSEAFNHASGDYSWQLTLEEV
ncbi:hypothetical protein LIN78_12155 [Leeia sp. TBRC 13508]|uniref:Uncharacterized protein n=1 Tax=Leeia speluncae TaxID=2884804 RepID=A0ABS8D7X9_9NEIS|nr:hypothetical protein [Leeia speluncae]MCB6184298.1 hypothetical protein [Leeia speluncae]